MINELTRLLSLALKNINVPALASIEIEIPKEKIHGDLSTPIAMSLARSLKKAPRKIAEEIINALPDKDIFEKIEIAGPGFINFTFTRQYIHEALIRILEGDRSFLRKDIGNGKKVLVEFVSANPTGPLHIGHARGAAIGNALCNLLAESGFIVEREYYINDAGRQVRLLGMSVYTRYQQIAGNEMPFPEDGYRGQYIDDEASNLMAEAGEKYKNVSFEECGGEITKRTYKRMLELIQKDLDRFTVRPFDNWVSEKALYESGEVKKAVDVLEERGYIYRKDGAVWFRSTDFCDDKDRVVIKSDGDNTYFASDIAYHKNKLDRGYDIIIDIWGADHHGYIPRIESVMQAFGYDTSRFKVILVQMVNLLKHGKPFQMSKRAGTFVTLSDIIDLVGTDITKFIFLTRKSDSHLDFDVDVVTATSSENPVFYVQYANARINSILENAADRGIDAYSKDLDLSRLVELEETRLIKKVISYPMALESATLSYEPHRITFYLQELAGMFHTYYHNHRIIGDDSGLSIARIALCRAIKVVIGDALQILGVNAPEKM